jgi:hypothetical protein
MADKIWKLGELEFDSELEYMAASQDLKRIKLIMERHDVAKPAEARAVLKELENSPPFASDYGMKFVEKLEKTAANVGAKNTAKPEHASKAGKKAPAKKEIKEKKVHIITRRNILIGAVIILVLVGAKIAVPYVMPYFTGGTEDEDSVHRNLVLAYAKNQVELKNTFYNYYKNVLGDEAEAASASADEVLASAYCINLADENVSNYTDDQIEEIYVKLITAGELVNNSFNEPQAITDLKATIAQAGAAGLDGDTGDSTDASTPEVSQQVNLLNKMMDYQQRIAAQLTYDYSHFDFSGQEVAEYVEEDMEKIFGQIVYDMELSDSEKEAYYSVFQEKGFFTGAALQRLDSNPVAYNLPDLTPSIKLELEDGTTVDLNCSQQTIAAAASVTYEIHDDKEIGYIVFRGNGAGTGFVQDDDNNSVTTQGDFFLNWNGKITCGEWYYNSAKLGFLVNDEKAGGVQYVYDLVY